MEIKTGSLLLWVAKICSVILSILMLMFIFGEGFPEIGQMAPREVILLVCFAGILTGLILIWFVKRAAAWTILGASAAFWLVEVIYTSSFWIHWFFLFYPAIAILIFMSDKYENVSFGKPKRKSRRK